ncbi:MAG: ACT domain-containing protein [Cellulomonas sp.]
MNDVERWVVLVRGTDRPGTLTALTSVFSTRGVSFESLSTGAVDGDGDVGMITVTFRTSARRQQLLVRTVERLSMIRSVEVRSADDPTVRAAGIVRMADRAGFTPLDAADVSWSGDASAGQPVLLEGSLADVTAVVAQARAQGAAMTAIVIAGI